MPRRSSNQLTGEALLKKVKDMEGKGQEEIAKACGYYTTTKGGSERVSKLKFFKALTYAQGLNLDGKLVSGSSRGGRSASYRISVQANGNLLIGSAYTKQMNLEPGDEFEITLGRKHIKLTQVSEDDAAV